MNQKTQSIIACCICLVTIPTVVAVSAQQAQSQSRQLPRAMPELSVQEIKELLTPERHLDNAARVQFYERGTNKPQEVAELLPLFLRQRQAIVQVGTQKLVKFVPQLVAFADYPDIRGTSSSAPPDAVYGDNVLECWPVFAAIFKMGEAAVPPLEQFVQDGKHDLRLRLTALQMLRELNAERAKEIGQRMLEEVKVGQKGAADRIRLIVAGKLRFWGMIDFAPITMSAAEVADLLTAQRHMTDAAHVVGIENLKNLDLPFTRILKNHEEKYKLFLRQKEAIYNAGELGLADLVPNLVLFMDYPRDHSGGIFTMGSLTLRNRRENEPALDAILKIGPVAIPRLEKLLQDDKQELRPRLSALSALNDIDAKRGVAAAALLTQEFKKADNQEAVWSVRIILGLESPLRFPSPTAAPNNKISKAVAQPSP